MPMFSIFSRNKPAAAPETQAMPPTPPPAAPHPLDAVTGGIFSADNSTQRQERVAQWLASKPDAALLQQVYKALSARDQGAAKPIRQRMNDIRQSQQQEEASQDWSARAEKILAAPTFHIADGMAWLRDAAKAGAPLSKEPLAELRSRIADQVKALEELQHKAMVQKEAAVLLAQRIDVLSTKPWQHAADAQASLAADVQKWSAHAQELTQAPLWGSVEPRHANAIDSSRVQLAQVFEAFSAALEQARQAAQDPKAELPQVQVWADELRALHGVQTSAQAAPENTLSPEQLERVKGALKALEHTVKQGQARESTQAAAALRASLKDIGGSVDAELEQRINRALIDAGDLQGWQRWGANQVREELIARAENLLTSPDGQPVQGGKALQTQVRDLHEQWRQVDRSSPPNGHLWKRFDEAISKARAIVDEWLKLVKAESQAHKAERQTLIDEVVAFTASLSEPVDLKALQRQLQQFTNRWRNAGHVSDKLYTQLQAKWKQALEQVSAPLEQARKASTEARRQLIEQAKALAEQAHLDVRAVKALQQQWQEQAQAVPLERKLEQKLWDAFRQPLDQAFNRKGEQRAQVQAVASAHDQAVLSASQALEAAIAAGHANAIRDAMQALEGAVRNPPPEEREKPAAAVTAASAASPAPASAPSPAETAGSELTSDAAPASEAEAPPAAQTSEEGQDSGQAAAESATEAPSSDAPAAAPAPAAAKPVVAVRGDDRPGAQIGKARSAAPAPGGRERGAPQRGADRRTSGPSDRGARDGWHERAPSGPRLGDRAFRAQRQALEAAQAALRKLTAQAHGEAVTQLLDAWKARDPEALPVPQQLSKRVTGAQLGQWKSQIGQPASGNPQAATALLRLEVAAEVPTPAEYTSERRMLQLQLLTQKHAAGPAETWAEDLGTVLATPANDGVAKRLQNALKVLLKR